MSEGGRKKRSNRGWLVVTEISLLVEKVYAGGSLFWGENLGEVCGGLEEYRGEMEGGSEVM